MLTEIQRRELFHHYADTEPIIYVDRHPYLVSVAYDNPDAICFYAVSQRTTECGAITMLPRDQWEKIDNGLCMAYLLNTVLASLEDGVRHTGGRLAYDREMLAQSR
jgi:hypothetical protein